MTISNIVIWKAPKQKAQKSGGSVGGTQDVSSGDLSKTNKVIKLHSLFLTWRTRWSAKSSKESVQENTYQRLDEPFVYHRSTYTRSAIGEHYHLHFRSLLFFQGNELSSSDVIDAIAAILTSQTNICFSYWPSHLNQASSCQWFLEGCWRFWRTSIWTQADSLKCGKMDCHDHKIILRNAASSQFD